MRRPLFAVFVAAVFVTVLAGLLWATSASHTVTIQVLGISEVAIIGSNILQVSQATGGRGSEPTIMVDEECALVWTTNITNMKITVATNLASPTYVLKALAVNVSGGTAAGEVVLSTTATDFVIDISQSIGGCNIRYTASATSAQSEGFDEHTITYTITRAT